MNKQMEKGRNMKNQTKMIKKNGGQPESDRIHVEFASHTAESVAIAGTFNMWQPTTTPMIGLGQGRGAMYLALPLRRLRVLPSGGRPMDTRSTGYGDCA